MARYKLIIYFLVILSTGCTPGGDFERKSYNLPEHPTTEVTELFRINSPADGAFFSYIRKIHILSDGNLVVQNYPDHQLYELTPNGEIVNLIGRQGRGPGEFIETYISHMTANDSLHVYDINNVRHQVFTKNSEGKWHYSRERIILRPFPEGMFDYIPRMIVPGPESDYFGIFRVHPHVRDTLSGHYAYVSKVDLNAEHAGDVSRIRLEHDLAIHKGENNSMTISNKRQFYKAFYNYYPDTDEVILLRNTSNEIIAINNDDHERTIGYLPYEHFPLDMEEVEMSLVNVNYYYSGMEEIVRSKLLEHEPYYRNVILQGDRLWVNLGRSDEDKPNWVITTLQGEVEKAFNGPKQISEVTIHNNRMYGSETDENGEVWLVGYELIDFDL